ncbi:hypothetical protein [Sphingobacterium sp. NPDC055346]
MDLSINAQLQHQKQHYENWRAILKILPRLFVMLRNETSQGYTYLLPNQEKKHWRTVPAPEVQDDRVVGQN